MRAQVSEASQPAEHLFPQQGPGKGPTRGFPEITPSSGASTAMEASRDSHSGLGHLGSGEEPGVDMVSLPGLL